MIRRFLMRLALRKLIARASAYQRGLDAAVAWHAARAEFWDDHDHMAAAVWHRDCAHHLRRL